MCLCVSVYVVAGIGFVLVIVGDVRAGFPTNARISANVTIEYNELCNLESVFESWSQ